MRSTGRPSPASSRELASDRIVPPAVSGQRGPIAYADVPDLVTARRLAGHAKRRGATLYYCGEPVNRRIAEIIRANLAPIGIDVHIDGSLGCLTGPETARLEAADLQLVSHFDAVPDPAGFVQLPLGDAYTAPGYWTDTAFRRQIEQARGTRGTSRVSTYSRLETELVRTAVPVVAYGSAVTPELFSARVGCEVSQGALAVVDLGTLCVRT